MHLTHFDKIYDLYLAIQTAVISEGCFRLTTTPAMTTGCEVVEMLFTSCEVAITVFTGALVSLEH